MNQFGIMVGLKKEAAFEGWFSKVDDRWFFFRTEESEKRSLLWA